MAISVTQDHPFKVTGTTASAEAVTDSGVYLKFIIWDNPTAIGHKLLVEDKDGNEIAAWIADVANKTYTIPIYGPYNGVYIADLDSGTLYVHTRQSRLSWT